MLWVGDSDVACIIYLLGGVVEDSVHRASRWGKSLGRKSFLSASFQHWCRLQMSLHFLKALLEHSSCRASTPSFASLARVVPYCVVPVCASSALLFALQLFDFLVADTLPLSLFFGKCFAIVVARADALPPTPLWPPLFGRCFATGCVLAPPLTNTLPLQCLRRMFGRVIQLCSRYFVATIVHFVFDGYLATTILWQILCHHLHANFLGGCFVAEVVLVLFGRCVAATTARSSSRLLWVYGSTAL